MNLSFFGMFIAGLLSFLSPCVLPLVPPYLCYMSGMSIADLKNGASETNSNVNNYKRLIISALAFVIGFTCVFVALGLTATEFGKVINSYRTEFSILAGLIIVIMGLNFLGVFHLGMLSREYRFQSRGAGANILGAFLMGLAFAFGWTPCIGPILGAALVFASQKEHIYQGALMLALYSAGLGVPFILTAIFSRYFMQLLAKIKTHLDIVEKIIGLLLVLGGLYLAAINTTMFENFVHTHLSFLSNL